MDTVIGKKLQRLFNDDQGGEAEIPLVSLNTLPEELIEMIFSFLNDSKDLWNVSNTSPQFTRIVHPRKSVFMFGEVFPLIFADLDQEDIFSCRLVCKEWNRSVDSYLQNSPESRYLEPYPFNLTKMTSSNGSPLQNAIVCNHPPQSPVYQPLLRSKDLYPFIFDDVEKLSNFLAESSTHPRNPFVLRFITLACNRVRGREMHDYWREITGSLLAKFGQEVHHVYISPTSGGGRDHDVFPYYRRLMRILRRLPNLKSLHLYRHDRYMPPVSGQLATRFQDYIETYPLPPLPQLETFTEVFLNQLPQEPIINELMKRYSRQLKTIHFSLTVWQENIVEFSNLSQCTSLQIFVDDSLQKWKRLCSQLEAPNLGKLSLLIKMGCRRSQIFKPLQQQNFQSLVYLRLRFVCKLRGDRRGQGNFLLENVKTLEVFENSNVPYDYLLNRLPKLEYMLVCCDPKMGDMEEEILPEDFEIRKWMYSEAMYKSNIWVKLKHLKEFTLATLGDTGDTENEIASKVIYNREVYNRLTDDAKNLGEFENLENKQ